MRNVNGFALIGMLVLAVIATDAFALNNGLVRTPPMGFNTWNWFRCNNDVQHGYVNEKMLIEIADAFKSKGMKDVGYEFINVDDCWAEAVRDPLTGGLQPSKRDYPHGMRAMADSIHKRGLKFGLYTNLTYTTCQRSMPGLGANLTGSSNHTRQDCDSFVAWGIDYIKVDMCQQGASINAKSEYTEVGSQLTQAVARRLAAGQTDAHPIVFAICNQGRQEAMTWGKNVGHLWRNTSDINHTAFESPLSKADVNDTCWRWAGPGGWNDPDMLEVGNAFSVPQDRSHFSLWCMMAAPLLAGNDVRNMNDSTRLILTNKNMVAVDQDTLGIQGRRVKRYSTNKGLEVWVKPLLNRATPDFAICFFNRGLPASTITISIQEIKTFVGDRWAGLDPTKTYYVRDLWKNKDLSTMTGSFTTPTAIPTWDCQVIQISPKPFTAVSNQQPAQKREAVRIAAASNGFLISGVREASEVSVLDLHGAKIATQRFSGNEPMVIPTSSMSRGMYFVAIKASGRTITQRVVVK